MEVRAFVEKGTLPRIVANPLDRYKGTVITITSSTAKLYFSVNGGTMQERTMTVESGTFVYKFLATDLVIAGTEKTVTVEYQIIGTTAGEVWPSKEATLILERLLKDLVPA